jgi:peroxiredoxin Q/BCP
MSFPVIGEPAPVFTLHNQDAGKVSLADFKGRNNVILYFYPKAMTPGCTKQACSLRDGWDELQQREVTIYGVSSDTAKTQAEFRDKHSLPFTLIADTDKSVAAAFGKGRWSRQAYLFQDGVLVWRDLSAATSGQMDDVIKALDQLKENH